MKIQKLFFIVTVIVIIAYFLFSASRGMFPSDYDRLTADDINISSNYPGSPKIIVEKYIDFDSKGAYLSARGKKLLRQLNKHNLFIQQELRTISIIDGYVITNITTSGDAASVTVAYNLIGEVEEYFEFKRKNGKEIIKIELKKQNGQWKIVSQIFSYMRAETYSEFLRRNNRIEEAKEFSKKMHGNN